MGRPRAFDVDAALDRALEVFWRQGFEGASLQDLTEAMGINRPSLYAAFGNKEALFRKVLDRYAAGPAGFLAEALQAPTARAAMEQMLLRAAEVQTDPSHPKGCLMVHGALACSDSMDPVREEIAVRRLAAEVAIRERLELARNTGELPHGVDCADLARYFATVVRGMAVQAVSGTSRAELLRVANTAMQVWPT